MFKSWMRFILFLSFICAPAKADVSPDDIDDVIDVMTDLFEGDEFPDATDATALVTKFSATLKGMAKNECVSPMFGTNTTFMDVVDQLNTKLVTLGTDFSAWKAFLWDIWNFIKNYAQGLAACLRNKVEELVAPLSEDLLLAEDDENYDRVFAGFSAGAELQMHDVVKQMVEDGEDDEAGTYASLEVTLKANIEAGRRLAEYSEEHKDAMVRVTLNAQASAHYEERSGRYEESRKVRHLKRKCKKNKKFKSWHLQAIKAVYDDVKDILPQWLQTSYDEKYPLVETAKRCAGNKHPILKVLNYGIKKKVTRIEKRQQSYVKGGYMEFTLASGSTYEDVNTEAGIDEFKGIVAKSLGDPVQKGWVKIQINEVCQPRKPLDDDDNDDKPKSKNNDGRRRAPKKGDGRRRRRSGRKKVRGGRCGCDDGRRRRRCGYKKRRLACVGGNTSSCDAPFDEVDASNRRLDALNRRLGKDGRRRAGVTKINSDQRTICTSRRGTQMVKVYYSVTVPAHEHRCVCVRQKLRQETRFRKTVKMNYEAEATLKTKMTVRTSKKRYTRKVRQTKADVPQEEMEKEIEVYKAKRVVRKEKTKKKIDAEVKMDVSASLKFLKEKTLASCTCIQKTRTSGFSAKFHAQLDAVISKVEAGSEDLDEKQSWLLQKATDVALKAKTYGRKIQQYDYAQDFEDVYKMLVEAKLEFSVSVKKKIEEAKLLIENALTSTEKALFDQIKIKMGNGNFQFSTTEKALVEKCLSWATQRSVAEADRQQADYAIELAARADLTLLTGAEKDEIIDAFDESAREIQDCECLTKTECDELDEVWEFLLSAKADLTLEVQKTTKAEVDFSVLKEKKKSWQDIIVKVISWGKRIADKAVKAYSSVKAKTIAEVEEVIANCPDFSQLDADMRAKYTGTVEAAASAVVAAKKNLGAYLSDADFVALDTAQEAVKCACREFTKDEQRVLRISLDLSLRLEISAVQEERAKSVVSKLKLKLDSGVSAELLKEEKTEKALHQTVTELGASAGLKASSVWTEKAKILGMRRLQGRNLAEAEVEVPVMYRVEKMDTVGDQDEQLSGSLEGVNAGDVTKSLDEKLPDNLKGKVTVSGVDDPSVTESSDEVPEGGGTTVESGEIAKISAENNSLNSALRTGGGMATLSLVFVWLSQ